MDARTQEQAALVLLAGLRAVGFDLYTVRHNQGTARQTVEQPASREECLAAVGHLFRFGFRLRLAPEVEVPVAVTPSTPPGERRLRLVTDDEAPGTSEGEA